MILRQEVHDLLAAINGATPAELKEAAKEMAELAKDHGSKISMRVVYRDMSKMLEHAAK